MKFALIRNGVVDAVSFEEQDEPWIVVEDDVFAGFVLNNGKLEAPVIPVLPYSVNAERDRRILQGKTFTLATGKKISLRGDNTTKENLQALAFAATLRIQQGAGASITLFRDETDYVHELAQFEILDLWTKSAEFVSRMFQAAWFLKDGPSIPQDYTDDKYWSAG